VGAVQAAETTRTAIANAVEPSFMDSLSRLRGAVTARTAGNLRSHGPAAFLGRKSLGW
jgi:hypothetical protein